MGAMNGIPNTFVAKSAADLSAAEWLFVKYSSGSTHENPIIELCASGVPCGILPKGEVAGRSMSVIKLNGQPAKLKVNEAIAIDEYCGPTTGGKGAEVDGDKGACFFVATEAATADNDIIAGYTTNMYLAV